MEEDWGGEEMKGVGWGWVEELGGGSRMYRLYSRDIGSELCWG